MSEINKQNSNYEFRGLDGNEIKNLNLPENIKFKKEEERKLIIILDHKELKKFRELLDADPKNMQAIQEFLEKQEKETVTNSEILAGTELSEGLGGIEKLNELSSVIEKVSYEHFFGKGGILENLKISEDAKRNFSVGANFFMLESLSAEITKNGDNEDIQKSIEKVFGAESGAFTNILKGANKVENIISGIKTIFEISIGNKSIKGIIKKVYNTEKEGSLQKVLEENLKDLSVENSEKQAILMNPLKTKELLSLVYNGASEDEIKKYITENNKEEFVSFSEKDKNKLQTIGNNFGKILGKESLGILGEFKKIGEQFEQVKANLREEILDNPEVVDGIKMLLAIPVVGEFIKFFLDHLGIGDIDKMASEKSFEKSKKTICENIIGKGSMFEGKKIGDDFMKIKENDDKDFVENINFILGNKNGEDFEKGILELFKKEGEFDKLGKQTKTKITETEEINYELLRNQIILFREYKIMQKENGNLTIEKFLEKKEAQKKKIEEQRKQNSQDHTILANADTVQEELQKADEELKKLQQQQKKNGTKEKKEAKKKLEKARKAKEEAYRKAKQAKEEARKIREKYTIKKAEKLEINGSEATIAFEVNGNFYKLEAISDSLFVTGKGERLEYNGGGELLRYLQKFIEKIDKKAIGEDFGENSKIKLNGHTCRDILVNGFHEKVGILVFKKNVNKGGLKQLFSTNFFKNGILRDKVSIELSGEIYSFEKVKV